MALDIPRPPVKVRKFYSRTSGKTGALTEHICLRVRVVVMVTVGLLLRNWSFVYVRVPMSRFVAISVHVGKCTGCTQP